MYIDIDGTSFGSPSPSAHSSASPTGRPAVKASSGTRMLNKFWRWPSPAWLVTVIATIPGAIALLWKAVAAIAGP